MDFLTRTERKQNFIFDLEMASQGGIAPYINFFTAEFKCAGCDARLIDGSGLPNANFFNNPMQW